MLFKVHPTLGSPEETVAGAGGRRRRQRTMAAANDGGELSSDAKLKISISEEIFSHSLSSY